ncbi:MAG: Lpg1974 family pore-forming outer membrane protein [Parachlamydiales bacterium]|jgi:hypothetical protein
MELMKKILPILLGALAISTSYADETNNNSAQDNSVLCEPAPLPPCCEIPQGPQTAVYNQPAKTDLSCHTYNFFASGSFLWIKPIQDQMEFASTFTPRPSPNINFLYKLNFDWVPAFNICLGNTFKYDNWDGYLEYTKIKGSDEKSVVALDDGSILQDFWSFQARPAFMTLDHVNAKWNLDFNMINYNIRRTYYNSPKLVFKAAYGLEGGWIKQKIRVESSGITIDEPIVSTIITTTGKSNSWLFGPKVSIYSNWHLGKDYGKGLRIFANGAASLFYQKFYNLSFDEPLVIFPVEGSNDLSINYTKYAINPSLEGIIGLGFGSNIYRNNSHLDISIGYQMQMFFNQNLMRTLQQSINTLGLAASVKIDVKPGNLMFHGLNVTAKLEF